MRNEELWDKSVDFGEGIGEDQGLDYLGASSDFTSI